jgi:hypothetical protein
MLVLPLLICGQTVLLQEGLAHDSVNQSANKPKYVERSQGFLRLSYEKGYVMPVDDKAMVNDLLKASSFSSVNLSASWDVSPTSVYSRIYRKPKLGIGLAFLNFHHPSFGTPNVLYGFTEIPMSRRDKRLNFTYGIGVGLAWNFHHYDKDKDPQNLVIGSSVNAHLQANINMHYWLSRNFMFSVGTGFRHYSNGALQKPNAGINVIPFTVSLEYKVMERLIPDALPTLPPFRKHWSYSVYNSVGAKQLEMGQPVVFKNLFGFNAGYKFSYKYRVAAGFDLTYTAGSSGRIPGNQSNFSKSVSYGPYVGWEWYLTDRIYLPIYLGTYLHRNEANEEQGMLFQRLGIRYALLPSRSLVIGTGLKSHLGSADFIEFTVGYNFR